MSTAVADETKGLHVARPPRDASVDVLKGIGIILIVLGHLDATPIGGTFIGYLYTFHVALFFVAAGYTWREKAGVSFPSLVLTKFRQIYVPYIVLFAISILYGHLVVRYLFHTYTIPFEFWATLKALLLSSEWLNSVPTYNFALWFLPIFFIASVAFQLLQKVRNLWIYAVLVLALLIGSIPFQQLVPGRPTLAVNVLPVALVFMAGGFLLKRFVPIQRLNYLMLLPLFAVTMWASYHFPGNVAAINTYWYFPSAFVSIVLYLRLAQDLRSSRFLAFVGRNSLIVFGIHSLVSNTYPHSRLPGWFSDWNGLMLYLLNAAYVVLGSVAVVKVYRIMKGRVSRSSWGQRLHVGP